MYLLCFLSFSLGGQAQVLLKQSQVSVAKGRMTTASMECVAEGISNSQYPYIHWYRHVPSRAPERILFIGPGSVSYDDNSYRNKYHCEKTGTDMYTFKINNINSDDEGTYYCAYW
ncbi:HV146 protein, partial [Smithornis capensis]|nr:HV146 protein [Smithornis capensis]